MLTVFYASLSLFSIYMGVFFLYGISLCLKARSDMVVDDSVHAILSKLSTRIEVY